MEGHNFGIELEKPAISDGFSHIGNGNAIIHRGFLPKPSIYKGFSSQPRLNTKRQLEETWGFNRDDTAIATLFER